MIRNKIILLCTILLALVQVPAQAWPFSADTRTRIWKEVKDAASVGIVWAMTPIMFLEEQLFKISIYGDKLLPEAKLCDLVYRQSVKERAVVNLLNKDANAVNKKSWMGRYAVHKAAPWPRSLAIVLAYNANPNLKNIQDGGRTTLMQTRDIDSVALLMACGARPEITNDIGGHDAFSYVQYMRDEDKERGEQFMRNPELAKKHVLENVLPNLQLSQKTKDKLKARILRGTKQGALLEYLKLHNQGPLYRSLADQFTKMRLMQVSRKYSGPEFPASVASLIMEYADEETFTKQADENLLKDVQQKATRSWDTSLAQLAQEHLSQLKPG